jgi:hypothetical protein
VSPSVTPPGAAPDHRAGLCSVCRHRRVTGNRRGSRFYLCELSKSDARFPRYPALPVVRCAGFERADPDPWDAYTESQGDEGP